MEHGLDTNTVSRRTGISSRRLGHWDRLGIVSPSISPARGSGSRRVYSEDDIAYVLLVNEMRRFGCTLDLARAVTGSVRGMAHQSGSLSGMRVVAKADKIQFCGTDPEEFAIAIQEAGGAMVYNVDVFVREAATICARPCQPSTEVVEVGGVALQFVIVPQSALHGPDAFVATCKAYPNVSRSGPTAESAASALRAAIESSDSTGAGSATESVQGRQRPAPSGASAWGGDW